MIDIQKIAREAGLDKAYWLVDDSPVHKFAALYREALIAELVAGSGEPCGRINEWTPVFTRDQLAGAVARERERIAELEAALDVALEAMQSLDGVGTVVQWAGQWELVHAAIAKLKEFK